MRLGAAGARADDLLVGAEITDVVVGHDVEEGGESGVVLLGRLALDFGERLDDIDHAVRFRHPLRVISLRAHGAGELDLPGLHSMGAQGGRGLLSMFQSEAIDLGVGGERHAPTSRA